MISPLGDFQSLVLSDSPLPPLSSSSADHLFVRVRNAVHDLLTGSTEVGRGDIAGLIRQTILRASLVSGEDPELRVPRTSGWPSDSDWQQFDCDVLVAGVRHYFVRPRPWKPSWLDAGSPSVVEAAIAEANRRHPRFVPSDPLVEACTGLGSYVSPGQRAAVQAAFLIPPGSAAVMSLPTGGGKTLAFQLPALAWADQGGLTLVIVPTIALAKDQEERFRELLRSYKGNALANLPPLAYHSGLSEEEKASIRSSLRDGSLPLLLASPESAMSTLRGPLFEAAQQGRLRCFAVDEAHIVTQWGQQFRPEFQTIAGLKDALLEACPPSGRFRTLLLTATLTAECWEALKSLFGKQGCQLISEVSLRPEPGFLLYSATDGIDRERRLLEAIHRLPRPLILYTTLREHAQYWYQKLSDDGFRRIRRIRGGDLADAEGEELLRDWRTRAVDIVVATSAFGLGMDQAEVRSVVHACLPETIDRYYQEVGRAGRDGKAAVSLLMSTPDDVRVAADLTEERIISVERGFERWQAMWVRRKAIENDVYLLCLDHRPPDIDDPGIRNASWNLRTLVLMARAGLLTFAPVPPPRTEPNEGEDPIAYEERRRRAFETFSRQVGIRLLDSRHSDPRHWEIVVAATRAALRAADNKSAKLVQQLRNLQMPLNDIFREVYTLSDPLVQPPRLAGSCPITRRTNSVSFQSTDPEVMGIKTAAVKLSAELERALAPSQDEVGRFWIAYEAIPKQSREFRKWHDSLFSLLRYMVSGGVVELSLPQVLLSGTNWTQLTMRSPANFLIRASGSEDQKSGQPFVPRLTFVDDKNNGPAELEQIMMIYRPQHIIVVPRVTTDPRSPHRRLLEMVRHLSMEQILARLQL
jgi:ATP-dependent DNA helicase RecQ